MRVAIFTNNYLPRLSGVSVAVSFLNTALNRHGHQTMIIAPDYGFDPEVPGVHVERVTSLAIPELKLALTLQDLDRTKIRYLIRGFRPDILHCHHPFLLGQSAVDMAEENHIPLVYTFHTLYEFFTHYVMLDYDEIRGLVRDYVLKFTDNCDLVITPTEPIKEYLRSVGVNTRTEAVPTGIDASRFQKVTPDIINQLKTRYRLDRFDHVLLSIGRLSKEKNVQLCLLALEELTQRGENCALLVLGDGPEAPALEKEAKRRGLKDRFILGGFLDQDTLAAAYFLGSVFLFPSCIDTQGIVLYEARVAGLPIVATDSMASRAAILPDKNGLLAQDNPRDFADKIQQILKDRSRYSSPSDVAELSHGTLGKRYDQLYQETVAQGRRPKPAKPELLQDLVTKVKALWGARP